jgi:hypothetical protein
MKRIVRLVVVAVAMLGLQATPSFASCSGSASVGQTSGTVQFSAYIGCTSGDQGQWLQYDRRWDASIPGWRDIHTDSGSGALNGAGAYDQFWCWAVGGRGIFETYITWHNSSTGGYGSAVSDARVLC